eukprot:4704273-Prymnesium_polylepis.1
MAFMLQTRFAFLVCIRSTSTQGEPQGLAPPLLLFGLTPPRPLRSELVGAIICGVYFLTHHARSDSRLVAVRAQVPCHVKRTAVQEGTQGWPNTVTHGRLGA